MCIIFSIACVYVRIPCVYLVLTETKKRGPDPWDLSTDDCCEDYVVLGIKPGLLFVVLSYFSSLPAALLPTLTDMNSPSEP